MKMKINDALSDEAQSALSEGGKVELIDDEGGILAVLVDRSTYCFYEAGLKFLGDDEVLKRMLSEEEGPEGNEAPAVTAMRGETENG